MLKTRQANLFTAALAVVLFGAVTGASVLSAQTCGIQSTFDSSLQDWTARNPSDNYVRWSSTGGNPDGCMKSRDTAPTGALVSAPSEFLGDWSALDGIGFLRFDIKVFDVDYHPIIHAPGITLRGPAGTAGYNFTVLVDTFWQTYQVSIDEALWSVNPPGVWNALLDTITEIVIGADYTLGGDDIGFDNICVGPTAPTQSCIVEPAVLDFGYVPVGSWKTHTFTVKNPNSDTLSGSVSESCPHYSIVSTVPPDDPYVLAPGESLLVTVLFEPTAWGTHVCTIETGNNLCRNVFCTGWNSGSGGENIPALTEWGFVVLILCLAAISIFYLRRRKRSC